MIEMTDCKHFRYNEIRKNFIKKGNQKTLQVANCQIGMGGMNGCPKYCPLYETN